MMMWIYDAESNAYHICVFFAQNYRPANSAALLLYAIDLPSTQAMRVKASFWLAASHETNLKSWLRIESKPRIENL